MRSLKCPMTLAAVQVHITVLLSFWYLESAKQSNQTVSRLEKAWQLLVIVTGGNIPKIILHNRNQRTQAQNVSHFAMNKKHPEQICQMSMKDIRSIQQTIWFKLKKNIILSTFHLLQWFFDQLRIYCINIFHVIIADIVVYKPARACWFVYTTTTQIVFDLFVVVFVVFACCKSTLHIVILLFISMSGFF